MFQKIILGIFVYTVILFGIVKRGGSIDFLPLTITQGTGVGQIALFVGLGVLLWFVYEVLRPIVKLLTLPINWLTLGIAHILLNIAFIYLFPEIVALFPWDVTITTGSFIEIVLLCMLLWLAGLLF